MGLINFITATVKLWLKGDRYYWAWIIFLGILILSGCLAYIDQLSDGLTLTNMRDPISWGFYIGNFTFLVGVAAAAIMLVIPAYIYDWGPIKEVVLLGELLAISAIVMCFLFVTVDIGRPDRVMHIMPFLGTLNFPSSLLAWDILVLNAYFLLNVVIAGHIIYMGFKGKHYNKKIVIPLVLLSVPSAVSIHTVTAFLYNGIAARPFWNASILAPRFLASAFCSGPAVLLILFQILRKTEGLKIKDAALHKIAELMSYAMFINVFLLGAEVFKEYYSHTEHLVFTQVLFSSVQGKTEVHYFMWPALACSLIAFLLFLIPKTRENVYTMNIGCILIFFGVYVEKGMGLVIPGLTPDTLGEIYQYTPSLTEYRVASGIFAIGFLVFTLLVKMAIPFSMRELGGEQSGDQSHASHG
ncbi:MAG: polysulfide reductase [Bdellovibrionales bacterium GWA2_49_15]|nr:MAG: polysulfide reductase [Bdellovibrionales bacterium GWA2_49_15]HAZ12482.1 polysulfide reductase [Bdellovibrionales bacterium]